MLTLIEKHSFIQTVKTHFQNEPSLLFEGLWDAPKAILILCAALAQNRNVLILTGGDRETRLLDDLNYFSSFPVYAFPSWETLPGEEISPSPDIIGKRFEILDALSSKKKTCDCFSSPSSDFAKSLLSKKFAKPSSQVEKRRHTSV